MKAAGWIFTDARGVERHGYIESQSDFGASDILYRMRGTDGNLYVVPGSLFGSGAYPSGQSIDIQGWDEDE